ncbi:MAG: Crp/Fnr family transcriptional regulator [Planctomycetes bacterium]|nr:Crp/Fnr family transcriptional regulator [Planctomycetota bacterium]
MEEISSLTEVESFGEGKVFFNEGDEADCMYVLVSGQVRIEREFENRKKTLVILEAGDFFGEMAIVTNGKRSATAVCSQDAVVLQLTKSDFLKKLRSDANICFEMLEEICLRLKVADQEIEHLSFRNLPGRIATKILDLANQFGVMTDRGFEVKLDITHHDLSEMVGTNRETVSKYVSMFKKEGSLDYRDKQITILDKRKLLRWS